MSLLTQSELMSMEDRDCVTDLISDRGQITKTDQNLQFFKGQQFGKPPSKQFQSDLLILKEILFAMNSIL